MTGWRDRYGRSLERHEIRALLDEIDAWLARTGHQPHELGAAALNFSGYVGMLRRRMAACENRVAIIRAFMAAHPDGLEHAITEPVEDRWTPPQPDALARRIVNYFLDRGRTLPGMTPQQTMRQARMLGILR